MLNIGDVISLGNLVCVVTNVEEKDITLACSNGKPATVSPEDCTRLATYQEVLAGFWGGLINVTR